jgi:protein N-terminal amidase
MAWLTREDARSFSRTPKEPDMETLAYWVARLEPLIRAEDEGEIIIILANRTGMEGEAVYAGTSAVLGIQAGEVKLYGVLGRGERELLVVDTSRRPQAKLVRDPETFRERTSNKTMNDDISSESKNSKSTQSTQSSLPGDEEKHVASIDEVLATATPLSPVEPLSPHIFFGKSPTLAAERQPLKSAIEEKQHTSAPNNSSAPKKSHIAVQTIPPPPPVRSEEQKVLKSSTESGLHALKSAINGMDINRKHSATPALDDVPNGVFERPSSPKSRNASRTRQLVHQEQALYTHDLAGMEPETRHTPSRNGSSSRNGMASRNLVSGGNVHGNVNKPHSANDAIVANGNDSGDEELLVLVEKMLPRPRSTGW